jgi:glucose dehydrogenase
MKKIARNGLALTLIAAAALSAGCATASKPNDMVATPATLVHRNSGSVSVEVAGGRETNPMWTSQISNDAFAQALRDSIQKSGLFSTVTDSGANYKLSVFLGKVDQPLFGLSLTVKMEVTYTLIDARSGKTLWQKDIASQYTAHPSDAFVAATRLRLANEGAARANIQQALAELSTLSL